MIDSKIRFNPNVLIPVIILITGLITGCGSNDETTSTLEKTAVNTNTVTNLRPGETMTAADAERSKGAMIKITENSPADVVRVFYKRLREKNFRNAIMLTNLRPAIDGLTDDEIRDLGVDFNFLAKNVPENMPINGEIVSGNTATVTVRLKNEETNKLEVQEIKLRREEESWTVLVADESGEKLAKKEGKNYFFSLRMDVHHQEAKAMLDRIGKAQMIYSMKFAEGFTDLETLISKGFVPEDAKNSVSTGYKYEVLLASNKSTYTALATPAAYGKTGKLSFALRITSDRQPQLASKDLKGRRLEN